MTPSDDPNGTAPPTRPPELSAGSSPASAPSADPNRTVARPHVTPVENPSSLLSDEVFPGRSPVALNIVPGHEVLAEMGRGGMGVVYKARHIKLNRFVALKLMLRRDRGNRGFLKRFLAEAEAVAAINHPNVVEVYDYGEVKGRPYIALEFCPGGSLADLMTNRRAALRSPDLVRDTATMLAQVARGVAAAHELRIVHRDLKPANILLQVDRRRRAAGPADIATLPLSELIPKVSDFGLAKRASSTLTATRVVMGTPAYMSPEQVSGKAKSVGPQTDVWALGVILYECLTGERPFRGASGYHVMVKVLTEDPPPLRSLTPRAPSDLETICRRCLEKNPADRYPTAREVADDLMWFVRGEPICARPVVEPKRVIVRTESTRTRPPRSRQRAARRARKAKRAFWAEVVLGAPPEQDAAPEPAAQKPKGPCKVWAEAVRSAPQPTTQRVKSHWVVDGAVLVGFLTVWVFLTLFSGFLFVLIWDRFARGRH